MNASQIEDMVTAYITCALWSSMDDSDSDTGGESLDANYSVYDIAPDTLAAMRADCLDFVNVTGALADVAMTRDGYGPEQFGHDFWLTRNRHGAGFWDRGQLDAAGLGRRLSDWAHVHGSVDLYVGDDGMIHA